MADKNIVLMFDANDHKGCLYLIVIEYYVLSPSLQQKWYRCETCKKKGIPYSITERRVLGSQPSGDMNHKPEGMLPLFSARPVVTPATLKRASTNFAAWNTVRPSS